MDSGHSDAAMPEGYRGGSVLRNPEGSGHGGSPLDYRSPLGTIDGGMEEMGASDESFHRAFAKTMGTSPHFVDGGIPHANADGVDAGSGDGGAVTPAAPLEGCGGGAANGSLNPNVDISSSEPCVNSQCLSRGPLGA